MCVAAIQGHSWLSQTHAIVLTACPTMVHMGREEESVRLGNSYIDFLFFYCNTSEFCSNFTENKQDHNDKAKAHKVCG